MRRGARVQRAIARGPGDGPQSIENALHLFAKSRCYSRVEPFRDMTKSPLYPTSRLGPWFEEIWKPKQANLAGERR
jgi:hypothetical protein